MKKGAIGALERGPKVGGQLMGIQIVLHDLKIGRGTADSFIMSAAAQCVQKVIFAEKQMFIILHELHFSLDFAER